MYRMYVSGKTVDELKTNIQSFLNMMSGEETTPVKVRQPRQVTVDKEENPELAQIAAAPSLPVAPTAPPPTTNGDVLPIHEYQAKKGRIDEFGFDSKGMPWDERIHAVSQGKNKDGTWRYRRGVEDDVIRSVEFELIAKAKEIQSASMGTLTGPLGPMSLQPVTIPAAPPVPTAPLTPQPVVAPPPIPQQPLTLAHTFETFKANLVPTLAKLVNDGKLTQEYIQSLKSHFGVQEIFMLNDTQLTELFNQFVQYGLVQRVG